jgi:hypothetical protein
MSNFDDLWSQMTSMEAVEKVGSSSKGSGVFGINQGASMKLFYGNSKPRDGASNPQITVMITTKESKDYMTWIQEPLGLTRKGMQNDPMKMFTKEKLAGLWGKLKSKTATPDEVLYLQSYVDSFNMQKAVLKNVAESYFSYVTDSEKSDKITEMLKNILKLSDFEKMLLAFMKLLPAAKNDYQHKEPDHYMKVHKMSASQKVDVFLQWQWSLKSGNKITFLELGKNTKHGLLFSAPQVGLFTKVEGLPDYKAINEEGVEHPITRSDWFMGSKFSKQQKEGGGDLEDMTTGTAESGWDEFVEKTSNDKVNELIFTEPKEEKEEENDLGW